MCVVVKQTNYLQRYTNKISKDMEKVKNILEKRKETLNKLLDTQPKMVDEYTAQISAEIIEEINQIDKSLLILFGVMHPLKTYDIHSCINEICIHANHVDNLWADVSDNKSFRYNIKKAIDKMICKK